MEAIGNIDLDIAKMDKALIKGDFKTVKNYLKALDFKSVGREYWVPLARLADRCELSTLIVKWFYPMIRSAASEQFDYKLNPDELALYANALAQFGSYTEAQTLLDIVEVQSQQKIGQSVKNQQWQLANQQVYFFKARLAILQFKFQEAIPFLVKYLEQGNLQLEQRLTGLLNLASCYTQEGEYNKSQITLDEVMVKVGTSIQPKCEALELRAQNYFYLQDYILARENIQESLSLFDKIIPYSANGRSNLLAKKKWLLVIELFAAKESNIKGEIEKFRTECIKQKDWESLRELDFLIALKDQDEFRFLNIYFGTNHSASKSNLLKKFNYSYQIPDSFVMVWSQYFAIPLKGLPRFDLETCSFGKTQVQISTPKLRKIFRFLASDIYRSFSYGEILDYLYPNEHFNPDSSTAKLNRLIHRLRKEIAKNKIPIDIDVNQNQVQLIALAPIAFMISAKPKVIVYDDVLFAEIKDLQDFFQSEKFNTKDASRVLKTSLRTTRRILNQLTKLHKIKVNKSGNTTNYQIVVLPKLEVA